MTEDTAVGMSKVPMEECLGAGDWMDLERPARMRMIQAPRKGAGWTSALQKALYKQGAASAGAGADGTV